MPIWQGFYLFYTPSGCIIQWMIPNRTTPKNKHNFNEYDLKNHMIFEITSVSILHSASCGQFQSVIALMSPSTNQSSLFPGKISF